MSVNTIHKLTNKKTSFMYNYWVKTVVESGLMDDYIILEYPYLVQVKEIKPDKTRINYKILPKREAVKLIEEHPYSFEIIELDIEKIKLDDLNKSRKIKSPNKTTIKYSKKTNSNILNRIYSGFFFVKYNMSLIFKFIIRIIKYIIKNPIKILGTIVVILTVIYLSIQLYEWYLENYTIRH